MSSISAKTHLELFQGDVHYIKAFLLLQSGVHNLDHCRVLAGLANTTIMIYGQVQSWEPPICLSAIGQSSLFLDVAAGVTG
jgi:hypothetical protein